MLTESARHTRALLFPGVFLLYIGQAQINMEKTRPLPSCTLRNSGPLEKRKMFQRSILINPRSHRGGMTLILLPPQVRSFPRQSASIELCARMRD